jgi:hypothetical protein
VSVTARHLPKTTVAHLTGTASATCPPGTGTKMSTIYVFHGT